jgi:hypothetical protein
MGKISATNAHIGALMGRNCVIIEPVRRPVLKEGFEFYKSESGNTP